MAKLTESPYIKRIKSKLLEPYPQYVHELEMLRDYVLGGVFPERNLKRVGVRLWSTLAVCY